MSTTKRSLFNKPAWAAKSSSAPVAQIVQDGSPIFGRNTVYEDIVAAEHKKRESHAARAKERGEKEKAKEVTKNQKQAKMVHGVKRRRISNSAGEDTADEESDAENRSLASQSPSSDHNTTRSRSITPRGKTRVLRSNPGQDGLTEPVISLEALSSSRKKRGNIVSSPRISPVAFDDDRDNTVQIASPQRQTLKPTRSDPESDEDDDYLRELKQKARAQARLKRLGIGASRERTPDLRDKAAVGIQSPTSNATTSPGKSAGTAQGTRAASTPASDPSLDPIVGILIRTIIPNTRNLVVSRHASQPLDKVREFWCQHNGLSPAIASKVFLTWNGTKLYNSTTMRGIIERLKKTHPTGDGGDPSGGKIELEAMTAEIWSYRQEQEEQKRREAAGLVNEDSVTIASQTPQPDSNVDDAPLAAAPAAQQKDGVIICLKCPGVDDFPVRVRPNTTIMKITTAYRKMRNIDPAKQIWLVYDGERLENDQTADNVAFEADDIVDVHLR